MGQVPQKDFQCRVLLNSKPTELAWRWKIRAVDSAADCHCREYFAFSHGGKIRTTELRAIRDFGKNTQSVASSPRIWFTEEGPLPWRPVLPISNPSHLRSRLCTLFCVTLPSLPRLLTAHDSFSLPSPSPSHGLGLFRRGLFGDWLALARLA